MDRDSSGSSCCGRPDGPIVWGRTRFGGWPDVIQDNMTLECELVSRGYNLGGLEDFPTHLAEREGAASVENWRLLFQLDSFEMEDFDLNFGDDGALYFYIRTEDLKARRFDRVWVILQCG